VAFSEQFCQQSPIKRKEIVTDFMQHSILIRVQYNETDGQGRVHHGQYLNYLERGRVELLRSIGHSYRDFELTGLMLVVSELNIRYLGAACFDDLLRLTTRVVRTRGVRIEHEYELITVDEAGQAGPTIVTARTTIACIDRQGKVARLPDYLREDGK
jgi:acyl-CoA thioester hydrolase